jgi:hypothetical protein
MIRLIAVVTVLLIVVIPATWASAQNLLVNHSFDVDTAGWRSINPNVTAVWRADAGSDLPSGSGPGALEVQHAFWNGGANGPVQEVDVTPSATYTFAASFFHPGDDGNVSDWIGAHLEWYTSTGQFIGYEEIGLPRNPPADVWTRVEDSFTAPSNAASATISLLVGNPADPDENRAGIGLFDDIVLAGAGADEARQVLFLPAAAKARGAGGTDWRTALYLTNLVDVPVDVAAALLPPGFDNSAAVANATVIATLPARGSLTVDDLVGALGEDGVAGGVALILTAQGLGLPATLVSGTSYTFTPNPAGSGGYGQGIPATPAGDRGRVVVAGVRQGADYRSNLGILNTSDQALEVDVTVRNAAGDSVGFEVWNLAPYEFRQVGVGNLAGGGLSGGSVECERRSATGSFRAYLSVVDQETGDAAYFEAR